MTFGPADLLVDFSIISVLLVGAQLLRSRLRWVQATHLPTAVVAGGLALVGGPYALDILPFSQREDGALHLGTYPSYLIALVFASLALGRSSVTSGREMVRDVGDTFFYNLACEIGQYGMALLFGLLVLALLFPELPPGFAVLLPTGFAGGHGTAAAIGGVFEQFGWEDALSLGYTSATVGVGVGIIGGMLLIHMAMRRGWTRLVTSPSEMPASLRTGFVPAGERASAGEETVSGVTIDAVSWHLALAGAAVGLAYAFSAGVLPDGHGIPLFALALIAGWVVRWIVGRFGVADAIDPRLMGRIGATSADYLIAFGVASIAVMVVVQYIVPLSLLFLFGVVFSVGMFWFVGRRIFRNYWFERSLFVFGWTTGVVAIGITLLRVVDPDARSRTLEDFGLAYTGISFIELALVALLPVLIVRGIVVGPALVLVLGAIVCLALSRYLLGWSDPDPVARREGEPRKEPEPVAAGAPS